MSGGRLLSVGVNRDKNHPLILSPEHIKSHASVHAEAAALSTLQGLDLSHATLFVVRVSNSGQLMYSKPCRGCEQLIRSSGIRKVVWS